MANYIKFLVILLPISFAPLSADNGATLYEQALDRMLKTSYKNWSFRQISRGDGETMTERYDGALSESKQWELISVNGKKPSKYEVRSYLKEKRRELAAEKKAGTSSLDHKSIAKMAYPGSVQLIEQQENKSIYSFSPLLEGNEKAFEKYAQGKLTVNTANPYIDTIEISTTKPITIDGFTVTKYATKMSFKQLEGSDLIVLDSILVKIAGKAGGESYSETSSVQFDSFRTKP